MGVLYFPHPPTHIGPMMDSAPRRQYSYCYGRVRTGARINGLSALQQGATKHVASAGKSASREPPSELPGSGPLQGKLKPPTRRVSLSPTKLETVMAALEIEPIESPHAALACVQQSVEPKETRELSLERRFASCLENCACPRWRQRPKSPASLSAQGAPLHPQRAKSGPINSLRARREEWFKALMSRLPHFNEQVGRRGAPQRGARKAAARVLSSDGAAARGSVAPGGESPRVQRVRQRRPNCPGYRGARQHCLLATQAAHAAHAV